MFAIIKSTPDEIDTTIISDETKASQRFFEEADSLDTDTEILTLARIIEGKSFGFGTMGDFYGGEVIEHIDETE